MSTRQSNQENSSVFDSNRSRRQQPTPSNIPSNQQQEPLNSSPSHSDQASKACCFCWCCCCSCSWYVYEILLWSTSECPLRCVLSNIFHFDLYVRSRNRWTKSIWTFLLICDDDDDCHESHACQTSFPLRENMNNIVHLLSLWLCWLELPLVKWNVYTRTQTWSTTRKTLPVNTMIKNKAIFCHSARQFS